MYLLDTNILSELRKPRADLGVVRWFDSVSENPVFVSVITLGEFRRGIEALRRKDAQQAELLDIWYRQFCQDCRDRILPVSVEIAETWGRLGVPDKLPTADGLLAATAKVHGLTVVTRNVKNFVRTGVRVHNPFKA